MQWLKMLLMAGLILLISSCSGSSTDPVTVVPDQAPGIAADMETNASGGNDYLWGVWEVYVDVENETVDAVPLRHGLFSANLNKLPVEVLFENIVINDETGEVDIDIGLVHNLHSMKKYTGFDVMGVFMGDGNGTFLGDPTLSIPGENDQVLKNADGYTRWFNANEFHGGGGNLNHPFQYLPGDYGTPGYQPSSDLNGYKYFADGLGLNDDAFQFLIANSSDRGMFAEGSTNWRHYSLLFPNLPTTGEAPFQYAVIGHWFDNINYPDPPIDVPDDFPPEANAEEALICDIVDNSTAWYVDGDFGGSVILDISPWDWSATCVAGTMDEYEIRLYSEAWTGPYEVVMDCTGLTDYYETFGDIDILVEDLDSAAPIEIEMEIMYPDMTYDAPDKYNAPNDADGPLASYFLFEVPVDSETPNGWARTWGGSGWDKGYGVAVDGSGNVYVTGFFVGTADFDPGSGDPHTSNGLYDVFLSKFDSSGNFEWARTWGGSDQDYGRGVAADGSGNVYVTCCFTYTVDFDPEGGDPHTSNGGRDVFLSKFDSSGNFEWARTWGGLYNDYGDGIATDSSGNVYVTGHFEGTVDFDPGGGDSQTSNGSRDVFLSKFDSSGNFKWARTWGGSWYDYGYGVAADGSGNVYVTGFFNGIVDFNPGGGDPHNANSSRDVFLSKFDSSGNFEWARTWGGSSWWDNGSGYGVATDGSGNVYVTGEFVYTVDFDPGGGDPHTSNGERDVFLSKFDSSGNFEWARTWGGSSVDHGYGVAADGSGNVYVTGEFMYTVDFNPGGSDPHTSNGYYDVFLSKFGSSGNFEWARTWGGSHYDYGYGVATGGSGNVYVTGWFLYTVDFAPTDQPCNEVPDERTSNGGDDVFLTKHLPDGCW